MTQHIATARQVAPLARRRTRSAASPMGLRGGFDARRERAVVDAWIDAERAHVDALLPAPRVIAYRPWFEPFRAMLLVAAVALVVILAAALGPQPAVQGAWQGQGISGAAEPVGTTHQVQHISGEAAAIAPLP